MCSAMIKAEKVGIRAGWVEMGNMRHVLWNENIVYNIRHFICLENIIFQYVTYFLDGHEICRYVTCMRDEQYTASILGMGNIVSI